MEIFLFQGIQKMGLCCVTKDFGSEGKWEHLYQCMYIPPMIIITRNTCGDQRYTEYTGWFGRGRGALHSQWYDLQLMWVTADENNTAYLIKSYPLLSMTEATVSWHSSQEVRFMLSSLPKETKHWNSYCGLWKN